jgi:hypothetical protein
MSTDYHQEQTTVNPIAADDQWDLLEFLDTKARDLRLSMFSIGPYSYATDGHIIFRVPQQVDFLEFTKRWAAKSGIPPVEHIHRIFRYRIDTVMFCTPPDVELPSAVACKRCGGSGHEHDCPDCECDCPECYGTSEQPMSATLQSLPFDLRYLRIVFALPQVEFASVLEGPAPRLMFRFFGKRGERGDGALMPLAKPFKQHIKLDRVETTR